MLEGANAIGETGSVHCGHWVKLYLKIVDNNIITDASFMAFGCAASVACCSALTQIIKNMTLDHAAGLSHARIAEYLGGLPKEKMHCSAMGPAALKNAIAGFSGRQKPGP